MIGTLFCLLMCVFTFILAALYGFDKNPDKTASTIAGFNNFSGVSEEERRKYDTAKMVKDMRNLMLILSAVCFAGIFLTSYAVKSMDRNSCVHCMACYCNKKYAYGLSKGF